MKLLSSLLLLVTAIALGSCFKEDEKVPPHARGEVKTDTVPLTENYRYQVWYSLDSGTIVRKEIKTNFDLGFDCRPNGAAIILNTADFMKVIDLGEVPFGKTYDTTGLVMRFDKSDGNPDSTAIDRWYRVEGGDTVSNHHVYAVSRGLDELGNPLGLYQVIFDSLSAGKYYFRFAPLHGGTASSAVVAKDPAVNFTWFSLPLEIPVTGEPPKGSYDLVFGQYTTMLYTDLGQPYPYLVTGVLLNRNGVTAAVDTIHPFLSITRETVQSIPFSAALDRIGYDWKYYNFTTGVYTIRPGLSYIVRTVSGQYFKMRFTAFYNRNGLKGYPVIEYQAL